MSITSSDYSSLWTALQKIQTNVCDSCVSIYRTKSLADALISLNNSDMHTSDDARPTGAALLALLDSFCTEFGLVLDGVRDRLQDAAAAANETDVPVSSSYEITRATIPTLTLLGHDGEAIDISGHTTAGTMTSPESCRSGALCAVVVTAASSFIKNLYTDEENHFYGTPGEGHTETAQWRLIPTCHSITVTPQGGTATTITSSSATQAGGGALIFYVRMPASPVVVSTNISLVANKVAQ